MHFLKKSFILCGFLFLCTPLWAEMLAQTEGAQAFFEKMKTQHQFTQAELDRTFNGLQSNEKVLALMAKPAEKWEWGRYKKALLTEKRRKDGIAFWKKHFCALQRAELEFGVPAEIIVALIGMETAYGRNTGGFSVLDALSTLSFDYPRRAKFFSSELESFLILSKNQRVDPRRQKGSYCGAIGIPQFMPSNVQRYAIDFSKSGNKDITHNPINAIGSVANFLNKKGWKAKQPITLKAQVQSKSDADLSNGTSSNKPIVSFKALVEQGIIPQSAHPEEDPKISLLTLKDLDGEEEYWLGFHNFNVIKRYNPSVNYAMAVAQLACELKQTFE